MPLSQRPLQPVGLQSLRNQHLIFDLQQQQAASPPEGTWVERKGADCKGTRAGNHIQVKASSSAPPVLSERASLREKQEMLFHLLSMKMDLSRIRSAPSSLLKVLSF